MINSAEDRVKRETATARCHHQTVGNTLEATADRQLEHTLGSKYPLANIPQPMVYIKVLPSGYCS